MTPRVTAFLLCLCLTAGGPAGPATPAPAFALRAASLEGTVPRDLATEFSASPSPARAGLEEHGRLADAVDLTTVPVIYPGGVPRDLSNAHTVLVSLDAGRGTRFEESWRAAGQPGIPPPKVLVNVAGLPAGWWTKQAAEELSWPVVSIVGYQKDRVMAAYNDHSTQGVIYAVQENSTGGTGHAFYHAAAVAGLRDSQTLLIATLGDQPLFDRSVLMAMQNTAGISRPDLVIATAIFDDPTGKGRVVHDRKTGKILGILEQRDIEGGTTLGGYARDALLAIRECNVSIYAMTAHRFFTLLANTSNDNAQHQYYVTDLVKMVLAAGGRVEAVQIPAAKAPDLTTAQDLDAVSAYKHAQLTAGVEEQQAAGILEPAWWRVFPIHQTLAKFPRADRRALRTSINVALKRVNMVRVRWPGAEKYPLIFYNPHGKPFMRQHGLRAVARVSRTADEFRANLEALEQFIIMFARRGADLTLPPVGRGLAAVVQHSETAEVFRTNLGYYQELLERLMARDEYRRDVYAGEREFPEQLAALTARVIQIRSHQIDPETIQIDSRPVQIGARRPDYTIEVGPAGVQLVIEGPETPSGLEERAERLGFNTWIGTLGHWGPTRRALAHYDLATRQTLRGPINRVVKELYRQSHWPPQIWPGSYAIYAMPQLDPSAAPFLLEVGIPTVAAVSPDAETFRGNLAIVQQFIETVAWWRIDLLRWSSGLPVVAEQSSTGETFRANLEYYRELIERVNVKQPWANGLMDEQTFRRQVAELTAEAIQIRSRGDEYDVIDGFQIQLFERTASAGLEESAAAIAQRILAGDGATARLASRGFLARTEGDHLYILLPQAVAGSWRVSPAAPTPHIYAHKGVLPPAAGRYHSVPEVPAWDRREIRDAPPDVVFLDKRIVDRHAGEWDMEAWCPPADHDVPIVIVDPATGPSMELLLQMAEVARRRADGRLDVPLLVVSAITPVLGARYVLIQA